MKRIVFLLASLILAACYINAQSVVVTEKRITNAFKSGELAWQFSDPDDVIKIFDKPISQKTEPDGGMELLTYQYADNICFKFSRFRDNHVKHFGLIGYTISDKTIWIDSEKQKLKPRNLDDLNKVNSWDGLRNMDVSELDLRSSKDVLEKQVFDTRTKWPPKCKLPADFDPSEIIKSGKNPGLGIKKLHAIGLDGKGVDIAIIDQPTLETHIDYKDNLVLIENGTVGPQMHGPFVTSIAGGKSCSVAPNATVYYFGVLGRDDTNSNCIRAIKRVVELNESGKANIKVISISTGMFRFEPEFDELQRTVSLAEAKGIVVITCAEDTFDIPTLSLFNLNQLRPLSINSRERPSDFTFRGDSIYRTSSLLIPGYNRTFASHTGDDVYVYSIDNGRSSLPPWLAGLVAIGYQVNPALTPEDVKNFLMNSAWKMPYGTVVNPEGFIELAKSKN